MKQLICGGLALALVGSSLWPFGDDATAREGEWEKASVDRLERPRLRLMGLAADGRADRLSLTVVPFAAVGSPSTDVAVEAEEPL